MTQRELRLRQAPLVEKYRNKPELALLTISARGVLGENITCRIQSGAFFKEAGLHPAAGGSGVHTWPGDMFLEALTASIGVTLNALASRLRITLYKASVTADAQLDFRGTMGFEKEIPAGFRSIKLKFDIDSDADEQQIKDLVHLTEKFCVVYQTLRNTPAIEIVIIDNKAISV